MLIQPSTEKDVSQPHVHVQTIEIDFSTASGPSYDVCHSCKFCDKPGFFFAYLGMLYERSNWISSPFQPGIYFSDQSRKLTSSSKASAALCKFPSDTTSGFWHCEVNMAILSPRSTVGGSLITPEDFGNYQYFTFESTLHHVNYEALPVSLPKKRTTDCNFCKPGLQSSMSKISISRRMKSSIGNYSPGC